MNEEEVLELLGRVKDDSPNANLIKHVKKMIEMAKYLNDDVQEAGELFRFTTYEFAARTCIRTLFSELEAKMFLFHELILHMHSLSIIKLSPEEIMLLKGQSCSVSGSGKVTTSQKFIPFKENLLFTLDLCSRFLNKNVFRDTNDKRWQDVLALIQIRNRITHPKSMGDLNISEHEVDVFNSAQDWLRKALQTMFLDPSIIKKKKK